MKPHYFFTGMVFWLLILSGSYVKGQGWIITSKDGVTYVSNGWIKIVETWEGTATDYDTDEYDEYEDQNVGEGDEETDSMIGIEGMEEDSNETAGMDVMFNVNQKSLILIDHVNREYASGTFQAYCDAVKTWTVGATSNITLEQKKMMEDYYAKQAAKPFPKVTIVEDNSGGNIAGYSTKKYKVLVDGKLYEEKWLTQDPSLSELLMLMNKVAELSEQMVKCAEPMQGYFEKLPENAKEYKDLELSGIELKSVSYEFGRPSAENEVISIEKRSSLDSEFSMPGEYDQLPFLELLKRQSYRE